MLIVLICKQFFLLVLRLMFGSRYDVFGSVVTMLAGWVLFSLLLVWFLFCCVVVCRCYVGGGWFCCIWLLMGLLWCLVWICLYGRLEVVCWWCDLGGCVATVCWKLSLGYCLSAYCLLCELV